MNSSLLRVASCNMQYGGYDREEGSARRWEKITGTLSDWQPHIILLQEMAALHPHELQSRLCATANKLNMTGLINTAVPYSAGGNYPAILYDYDAGLRITDAGPPSFPPEAGPPDCWCSAVVMVPGLGHPLAVYSVHMPARTATGQAEQAERLASVIAQHGMLTIAGGDWNCYPPDDDLTPGVLEAMTPHLRPVRMIHGDDGWRPNLYVHQTLTGIGMADAAALPPPEHRDPPELAGTGNGGHGRIDRWYVSGGPAGLGKAVTAYEQRQTASDHDALLLVIDVAKAAELAHPREPAP